MRLNNKKNFTKIFLTILSYVFIFSQVTEGRYSNRNILNPNRNLKSSSQPKIEFVPGEVIVKYKDTVSNSTAAFHSRNLGYSIKKRLINNETNRGATHLLNIDKNADINSVIQSIQSNSNVEFAQPNYIYRVMTNDTNFSQLWALKNTGQIITGASYSTLPGTAGKDIDAESAWTMQSDCSSTVVAVIDTGVNYNQQDLTANMATGSYSCPGSTTGTYGCDFVGVGDNDPMDLNGHGTHVAGIIGAQGNNSLGITGVCQSAKILAARVLDASGSGTTADITEALNWAVGTGSGQGFAKIVNMSLGGGSYDTLFYNAINNAATKGVVVVVAAGNSALNHNQYMSFPCDYDSANIVCVAAATQKYQMASFSDYDSNPIASSRKVDVGAPGTDILSSFAGAESIFEKPSTQSFGAWTYSPTGWGTEVCTFYDSYNNPYPYSIIEIPFTPTSWCSGGTAGNNIVNSVAQKIYNFTGTFASLYIDFLAFIDLNDFGDKLEVVIDPAGGNLATGGTVLGTFTGLLQQYDYLLYDLTACSNSATCSIGFRYNTDANGNALYDGIAILDMYIIGLDITSTNSYYVASGTSMASPVAAGIAALLYSHNPNYDYADVVESVIYGGDAETSMSGKTKSGMVVDAYQALKYLPAPRNVTLTAQ